MASPALYPQCIACDEFNSTTFCTHGRRTIRRCLSCDLLFVFPQPDADALHEEFQSDYFAKGRKPGESRLDLEFELWRQPTMVNIVERICEMKNVGKVLDVGCASGELFAQFQGGGWQFYGVEPSALAYGKATERFEGDPRVRLFNAYLSDLHFVPNSFDVITLLESLYYIKDPRRELSVLAPLLKEDGLLAIAVPGYAYIRLRHNQLARWATSGGCSLTASHLFYFSEMSMMKLLATQGFRIFRTVQLGTSVYGNVFRRFGHSAYVAFARGVEALTFGRIKLAPHVLYLCRKTGVN